MRSAVVNEKQQKKAEPTPTSAPKKAAVEGDNEDDDQSLNLDYGVI